MTKGSSQTVIVILTHAVVSLNLSIQCNIFLPSSAAAAVCPSCSKASDTDDRPEEDRVLAVVGGCGTKKSPSSASLADCCD